jgi:hypothetical protein
MEITKKFVKIDSTFFCEGERLSAAKNIKAAGDQGDQMSLRKNRPKCGPTSFFSKINT